MIKRVYIKQTNAVTLQELPKNPSWLLRKAVRAFYKEHYKTAKWLACIANLRNPNDYFTLCWYANGLYFSEAHNDHKAASLYMRAIEINPSHPLAHAGLGRIHYSNACRIIKEYKMFPGGPNIMFADELSPGDESLIRVKGFADFECGNIEIAIKELEQAADLASDADDKVELLCMAAELHASMNNKSGIKAFKKILDIEPKHIPAHFHLAGCYVATGHRELALQEYEFIQENAPDIATDLAVVLADYDVDVR